MSANGELSLGIIAFAVVILAIVQVLTLIAGIRLVRRVEEISVELDRDLKPLVSNLTVLSTEAVRAASMANKQIERVDHVFGELVERVDHTLAVAEEFVTGPARQGMAIVAGIKAAFDAFNGLREVSRRRSAPRAAVEEEESLFIG